MNNVIPLKRPEHVIPDHERRELVNQLTDIAREYRDFGCLRLAISKCVDDALKRKDPGEDLISTPQHVKEKLWREHFGLNEENADGEDEFPPAG